MPLDAVRCMQSKFLRPVPLSRSCMTGIAALQVDDMCEFGSVARAAHSDQGLPICAWFLAGFSLGGLTAAHVAVREQEQWQGLVLVGGCMWVRMTIITQ